MCAQEKIKAHEVAYFFDDVLDLPIAESCGLRVMVNQKANPLFLEYCKEFRMVDYATANSGGDFAVREACELLMALNGNYAEVLNSRKNFDSHYDQYIQLRRDVKPEFFTLKDKELIAIQQGKIGFGK